MKLTIITSLYRSEKFLPSFLKEIKKVHCEMKGDNISFEHLLIFNDQTETEKRIISNYKNPNIKISNVPRENLYSTWNRGIRESKGDNICFWNVDDQRNSESIIDGISLLENDNLIYFPFIYIRYIKIFNIPLPVKIKKISPPEFNKEEFGQSMQCGPFFMFTRKFFEEVGEFNENFRIAGDFDWCIRASKIGSFKKSKITGGTFINNGNSLSGSKDNRHIEENAKIYQEYGIKK